MLRSSTPDYLSFMFVRKVSYIPIGFNVKIRMTMFPTGRREAKRRCISSGDLAQMLATGWVLLKIHKSQVGLFQSGSYR